MRKNIHLSLRAGERIFINGAVLKADRKVSIELLNDATFLLEHHVLQPEETTTPLRQLYFALQTMVMDPASAPMARHVVDDSFPWLLRSFSSEQVLSGLNRASDLVAANQIFEALKTVRAMFSVEDEILGRRPGPELKVMEAV